jgi:hypothetical protein
MSVFTVVHLSTEQAVTAFVTGRRSLIGQLTCRTQLVFLLIVHGDAAAAGFG